MTEDVLDRSSPLPLYAQIAGIVERRVYSGRYRPGEAIPPEQELARAFGVGRPTMRQAIEMLVRREMLERRKGSGTYVLPPPPEVGLFSLGGTLESLEDGPVEFETRLLGRPKQGAGQNSPFPDAVRVERLSLEGKAPVFLEVIELDAGTFPGIAARIEDGVSLSKLAQDEYGLTVESAAQTFHVWPVDGAYARQLKVKSGTPLLNVMRTLSFRGVGPAVVARMICKTDEMQFSQVIYP